MPIYIGQQLCLQSIICKIVQINQKSLSVRNIYLYINSLNKSLIWQEIIKKFEEKKNTISRESREVDDQEKEKV